MVALGGLFMLTLLVPWWGRRDHAERVAFQAVRIARPAPQRAPSTPEPPRSGWAAPALPPLAGLTPEVQQPELADPPLAATAQSGAVVESDDYVVVDEPLVETTPTVDPAAPAMVAAVEDDETTPSAVAESFAMRPSGQSVVVRSAPAPVAPERSAASLESLVRVRDALVSLMEQARERQHAAAAEAPAPQRVVVHSENDRLAMVPEVGGPAAPPAPQRATTAPPASSETVPALPALRQPPTALLRDFAALKSSTPAATWADAVESRLDQLAAAPAPAPRALQTTLAQLRTLSVEGLEAAATTPDPATQSAWIRASRALDRRLPVWQLLLDERTRRDLEASAASASSDGALLQALHEVAALTAGAAEGAAWRQYLRLDDLAGLTSIAGDDYLEARRAASRDVLTRMADPRLSADQREFLAQPPLAALGRELRPWARGVVSLDALAALVEHYEQTGSLGDAEAIAELRQRMRWSDDPRLAVLADDLNRNYRNANVRVALAAEMFNRLIPPQDPVAARVNETIGGTDVRGRSVTETQVHVRLIPDAAMWRLALEVQGTVQSRTYSDVGPARLRNATRMEYDASKLITLDRAGLQIGPAQTQVTGRSQLLGVDSGVPLFGPIIEDVVRDRHQESKAAAIAQVKTKVGREARRRMDREADAKLMELKQRIADGVFGPLDRFAVDCQPVDMSTTEERAVVRLRLACDQQLAAHTPRPSAPSDSLASLQLHESAINNAIRGMGLERKRLTVGELHELLTTKFTQRDVAPPSDLPRRALVEFAAHDAVRVTCRDDAVELSMHIVELRKGRDSIRNVVVHAFYKPVVDGLEVRLVRDGGLQFEGAHLRTGTRLVLHSVFGKLLQKGQDVPLLAKRFNDDQRFTGLMVTQLVIDDGWVAMSLGPALPNRTAWRTRTGAMR